MPSAPWQLWVDIAPLSSVTAVGGTVTVTTQSAHGATVGAYVQLSGLTAAGTTMLGVAPVATVTSGTVFTCVISGASGREIREGEEARGGRGDEGADLAVCAAAADDVVSSGVHELDDDSGDAGLSGIADAIVVIVLPDEVAEGHASDGQGEAL